MARLSRTLPQPKDAVLSALQQVIARRKWTIDEADPDHSYLRFHTGLSIWTWSGQKVGVSLTTVPEGTRLDVDIDIRRTGFSLVQFVDWGEGRRIAKRALSETCEELGMGKVVIGDS